LLITVSLSSCGTLGEAFQEGYQAGFHFARGNQCYKSGADSEAEKELKEALEAADKCKAWTIKSRCLVRMGQLRAKQGKNGEADSDFKEALEVFDRNAESPYIKKNYHELKDFWIMALHGRSAILQKLPNRASEAQALESKAKGLESN
jgi:hypothetical protein